MELIIKVDEKRYEEIKQIANAQLELKNKTEAQIIANGTPLPKGHGRLGDLDAVMNDISTSINAMTNIGITIDGDYLWAKLNDAIDNATTIVEADKENNNA